MKKTILIVLLCFIVAFAAFAIDMSPHPGDSIETVFSIQENLVMSQAVSAPANNMLYLEQFNFYNDSEICMSTNEEITGIYNHLESGLIVDIVVSYAGYEAGTDMFMRTQENVTAYCADYG